MASASADEQASDRRKQVLLGDLPDDFLRLEENPQQRQIAADEQAALALQQQLSGAFRTAQAVGRLTLSVTEAKLMKNYGVTRMDPYVRIRIGHNVYETHTDYNGAKNPKWNKIFHCFLSPGVNGFLVEIYDECAFTVNEKIAWAHITIPETTFSGETSDLWHPLSGRQGEGKEGAINIVMSYQPIPPGALAAPPMVLLNNPYMGVVPGVMPYPAPAPYMYPPYAVPAVQPGMPQPGMVPPGMVQPGMVQPPVNTGPNGGQVPLPAAITDADVKQVQEMFPGMDAEVIKGVLESHRGNKDATVNALLSMSS
ncbi:toll-interacting protein-like isoform X2 [Ornithodoros turicata]|uniref:toll-interacting protein-like isoform X2 n=1 Tax=Ornithodoros turicata TaxID=34597 RepID=UPI003139D04B